MIARPTTLSRARVLEDVVIAAARDGGITHLSQLKHLPRLRNFTQANLWAAVDGCVARGLIGQAADGSLTFPPVKDGAR